MAEAVCFIGDVFDKGLGHSIEAKSVELVESWMF